MKMFRSVMRRNERKSLREGALVIASLPETKFVVASAIRSTSADGQILPECARPRAQQATVVEKLAAF